MGKGFKDLLEWQKARDLAVEIYGYCNALIGTDTKAIGPLMDTLFSGAWKTGGIPEKWDGKAAERIVNILMQSCTTGPHESLA